MQKQFLPYAKFNNLLNTLSEKGYSCIGPQVRDGAVVFDELSHDQQLPWGMQDMQEPGKYRLQKTTLKKAFAWANGPQAIKPLLFKPQESLWQVARDAQGQLVFNEVKPKMTKPIALIGARACDLAGMAVQDKVFLDSDYQDKHYQQRRKNLLIIAVNCSYSAGNCFCVSTNTGPKATAGFDLALTEIDEGFTVEIGSDIGEQLIAMLYCDTANKSQLQQAENNIEHAASMQTKAMPKNNSRQLLDVLMNNLDHPRWDDVASRCLSCGNCTQVCPTCFCHHQTETSALDGQASEHAREWDSCFTAGHSYIHGKVIRDDTKSRYKQWLTHKLGTWWEQFDTSGCIGCGRCITWCPVGIDIIEEMTALCEGSS